MSELGEFEVDEHVAAQEAIVKDEVDEEVIFVKSEAFLPSLEQEAFAKFEQKVLNTINDSLLEV